MGSPSDFGLVRYNRNGSLDSKFGQGGKVVTDFGVGDVAEAVAIQKDRKIVVAGRSTGTSSIVALARYRPDGKLDRSFDGDGKLTTVIGTSSGANALAMQKDGRILAGGFAGGSGFALARYLAK